MMLSTILFLTDNLFAATDPGRAVLSFNQNWQFYRVDDPQKSIEAPSDGVTFDDVGWEKANLPHTVRL